MKPIAQENSMGCGIACVAFALQKSYKRTKKLFENPEAASMKGYYCRDLVKILNKKNKNYDYAKLNHNNKKFLRKNGTIIFVKKGKRFPAGHYLIKTEKGWMDSWINFPSISPAKAGFRKKLPEKPEWIIFQK